MRAAFDRFVAAQNAHDVKSVESLLLNSPDFLWITRGTPVCGADAAVKQFAPLYQGARRLDPERVSWKITMLKERVAQVYIPIMFTIGAPDRSPQQTKCLMNRVLVRTQSGWRVSSILHCSPAGIPTLYPHLRRRERGVSSCEGFQTPAAPREETFDTHEFIRCFLMHVLPEGFHRIRYYGLLTSPTRANNIARIRKLLAVPLIPIDAIKAATIKSEEPEQPKAPEHPCPCCGSRMRIIETFLPGQQPKHRPTPVPAKIRIDTS